MGDSSLASRMKFPPLAVAFERWHYLSGRRHRNLNSHKKKVTVVKVFFDSLTVNRFGELV